MDTINGEEVYWQALPLDDESLRVAKIRNVEYEDALKKNLTKKFFQRLRITSGSRQNLIICVYAPQGRGKSYCLMFTIEKLLAFSKRTLPLSHCCFTLADMAMAIQDTKEGEVFVLDEQVRTAGFGAKIEKDHLKNIEMTVRQNKLSLFFAAPELIEHTAHFYLEVWDKGATSPWDYSDLVKNPIEKQWKYTKSILYDDKLRMLGYVITGTPSDKDFLEKYEAKKAKFIDEIKHQKSSGRSRQLELMSKELQNDKEFINDFQLGNNKPYRRLLLSRKLSGGMVSTTELEMLLSELTFILTKKRMESKD